MVDIVIFPEDNEDGIIFEFWTDDCLYNDDDYEEGEDYSDEIYED